MPTAVTHILVPLILVALYRDYVLSDKERRSFPLHYVLIAGLGGALPDLDIGAFWILHWFGFTLEQVHRTAFHSIFVPLILLGLAFLFSKVKIGELGRHKLTLSKIFVMLAIGTVAHICLDGFVSGDVDLFAPFSDFSFGFNLVGYLPPELSGLAIATMEGILLIFWLVYLEWKHKISDFI